MKSNLIVIATAFLATTGCARMDHIGKPPSFSPAVATKEHSAMLSPGLPLRVDAEGPTEAASLWSGARQSLLGDRRAIPQIP